MVKAAKKLKDEHLQSKDDPKFKRFIAELESRANVQTVFDLILALDFMSVMERQRDGLKDAIDEAINQGYRTSIFIQEFQRLTITRCR